MKKEDMILKLKEIHGDDKEQLNFILSNEEKIVITASAGCGKTKTMISKIAYELITTPNLNFKKILALTFSVNASTKIKEDTSEVLPKLLNNESIDLDKKLDVSNYHSFATKILFKHGYSLNNNLKNIKEFRTVPENTKILKEYLIADDIRVLSDFSRAISEVNIEIADELFERYKNILLNKLIPNSIITYNGLLVLGFLLLQNERIRNFYVQYYPIIIVDEFQDTNYLSYKIITSLIDKDNKVYLMGDDIQKIYGFLGAMPNLFSKMKNDYKMTAMEFNTNYRFKDNPRMLKLDKYIRQIFIQYDNMKNFREKAEINMGFYEKQETEIDKIYKDIIEKTANGFNIAVLVNKKTSAENIIKKFENEAIKYFNGLFSDTDNYYIKFHKLALEYFITESGIGKSIAKRVLDNVILNLKNKKDIITNDEVIFNSLIRLLIALFENVKKANLSKEEKHNKISFVLSNSSLKRLMNEIDEQIVVTTIHGSKGLEWDYIYIPQITQGQFPVYFDNSLCKMCKERKSGIQENNFCKFTFPNDLKSKFKEELSLFYVAITRAKKDAYLFANFEKNEWGYTKKRSCLTTLPNLDIVRNSKL